MFLSKRSGFSFMVAIYLALALASAGLVGASGHEQMQDVHRRVNQNRMIKKRQLPDLDPSESTTTRAAAPSQTTTQGASTTLPLASANTTPDPVTTTSRITTPASVETPATGISISVSIPAPSSSPTSASSSSSSSSSTSSSSSSSSSTSSTTSTTAKTSDTPAPTPDAVTTPPPAAPTGRSTVHTAVTRTVTSAQESETSSASNQSAVSKTTKTTLTVIAAIAGSVGGAFLLWTIIRKWKFRPSREFEDRMQPIDWQPTDSNEGALPGHHRQNSVASSFHSGAGHTQDDNLAGRGMAGYGATSDHGPGVGAQASLQPVPDHDFTAALTAQPGLAPVGGYADLARGSSPQPQMQQVGYDHYAAPVQYQQGYGQQEAYYNNGQRY